MKNILRSIIQGLIFVCTLLTVSFSATAQMGVWPGDADNNGVVNVVDQLYMGYAFGAMGHPRVIQGIEWQNAGVPPTPWTQEFPEGLNYFYADADGNGIVDLADFAATDSNYALTHGVVQGSGYQTEIPAVGSLLDLQLNEPLALLEEGELRIDVALGTLDVPVEDFYGLAFKLKYEGLDNTPISAVEFREADNSWIGEDAVYSYARNDAAANEIDVTVTRLDRATSGGGGVIGQLVIVTDDIVLSPTLDTIGVTIDSVRMIGGGFVDLPVLTAGADLILGKSICEANFSTSPVGCATIQFTDQSAENTTRPIDRWQWDFGDGRTSSLPSPTHIYQDNGNYNTCLTIRTLDGCESTYCEEIIIDCINNGCPIRTSVTENTCSEFQFAVDDPDPMRDYFWSVNDSLTAVTDATYLFQTDTVGVFTICGGYEDLVCPSGSRYCRTVTVADSCFVVIDCDFTILRDSLSCEEFSYRTAANQLLEWSLNGSSLFTDSIFNFNADAAGTYEICGFYQNENCPDGATMCDTLMILNDCFFVADCDFMIIADSLSCNEYQFRGSENELLAWTVDETLFTTDTVFNFTPTVAGAYEICAFYQNDECPDGAMRCQPVTISDDCFFVPDCDFTVIADSLSCNEYQFRGSENEFLTWTVDETLFTTDTIFNFTPTVAGVYEICAFYQNDECPDGAMQCQPVTISDDCFFVPDCDFTVIVDSLSCNEYQFRGSENEFLTWTVDETLFTTDTVFNFTPTVAGTYEICAFYQNDECPDGAMRCQPVTISDDCFFVLDCDFTVIADSLSCNEYEFRGSENELLAWTVDETLFTTDTVFNFTPTVAGTYEICAFYQNDECPDGAMQCQPVTISDDCFFVPDCDFTVIADSLSCDEYQFRGSENELLAWTVDETLFTTDTVFNFIPTVAGTYEICAFYQNDECPDGAMQCQPVTISDDCFFVPDCDFTVIADSLSCDAYRFSGSGNENLNWRVNGVQQLQDSIFTFNPTAAGTYEICAYLENENCPNGATQCDTLTITDVCFATNCEFSITPEIINCAEYRLTASDSRVLTWAVNDSTTVTDSVFNFVATAAGTYEICGIYQADDCLMGTTECLALSVVDSCFIDGCAFSLLTDTLDCANYQLRGNNNQLLFWYVNDSIVTSGQTFDFQPDRAGTYEVCGYLQNADCEGGATVCTAISVTADCFVDCNFSIAADSVDCANYQFSATKEVTWSVNDRFILTDTTFDFRADTAGNYVICGYLENANCPDGATICDTLMITDDCLVDAVINNGLTESVIEYLAPNPARAQVRLQLKEEYAVALTIVDIRGRTLRIEERDKAAEHRLAIGDLAAGVYFLQVWADGKMEVVYFVKQ